MEKLENFIEKYLKTKKKTDYEGWLALYGRDSEEAYRKDKKEADSNYARALAQHGRRASKLNTAGLSDSGYSDYLNHTAYATRADELYAAKERKKETDLANQKGYVSFLKELSDKEEAEGKEQEAYEKKVFDTVISKGITDDQSAVLYMLSAGLEPARAQELASRAVAVQKGNQSLKNRLITAATAANMDHYSAYRYAVYNGVTEEVARQIADAVDIAVRKKRENYYRYHY